jgi:cytochrome c oxidase subunit IV
MSREHRHLLICWLGLFVLAAIEFGCSFIHFDRSWRPLLLLPALCMVALVGLMFMGVRSGPDVVRVFAIAALFWLVVLLGLGMMDPLTRGVYQVVR